MNMIEIIKVIILGLVEGITEWLPISSTGHMILVDEFLHLNITPAFKELFLVIIQLGAILAVVLLYFKKLNPFKKDKIERNATINLWFMIIVGCIPAGIIGVLFNNWFDKVFYNAIVVAISLIVYGILFIVIENKNKNKGAKVKELKEINIKTALKIGLFQLLSLIPGTSRSGTTILGGLISGVDRSVATEYTFFLAIPVMFGASLIKLLKFGFDFTRPELIILIVGVITAFLVSILVIKLLMKYIKRNDFKVFGWYRIILGIIVLLYFILK